MKPQVEKIDPNSCPSLPDLIAVLNRRCDRMDAICNQIQAMVAQARRDNMAERVEREKFGPPAEGPGQPA